MSNKNLKLFVVKDPKLLDDENMKLSLKESSNIQGADYTGTTLTVTFKSGYKYEYYDVPADVVSKWLVCANLPKGSTGSQFYGLIREGGFKYKRLV